MKIKYLCIYGSISRRSPFHEVISFLNTVKLPLILTQEKIESVRINKVSRENVMTYFRPFDRDKAITDEVSVISWI